MAAATTTRQDRPIHLRRSAVANTRRREAKPAAIELRVTFKDRKRIDTASGILHTQARRPALPPDRVAAQKITSTSSAR